MVAGRSAKLRWYTEETDDRDVDPIGRLGSGRQHRADALMTASTGVVLERREFVQTAGGCWSSSGQVVRLRLGLVGPAGRMLAAGAVATRLATAAG